MLEVVWLQFVQFKYKNLGDFCEHCGMISHRKCEKVAKQRCLTRAGLKRYDSQRVGKGLSVKSHYSQSYVDMGLLFEETLTYAQFMVEVRVDVVYASEHEWGGKKLIRSLLVSKYDYCFGFPCFPTRFINDVLPFEEIRSHIWRG